MSNQLLNETKQRMSKSEESLRSELSTLRAGNANPNLLNHITVDYYGVQTPVNQLAQVAVPEPRMITVKPYDKSALGDIERAIQVSDLGIAPQNDGELIRLTIPQLTEERRKELAKRVGEYAENAKISVRNIRRDAMDQVKSDEKDGSTTEDELRNYEKQIQDITDESVSNIDQIAKEKEEELMTV